ncbi:hypothetical protein C0993_005913 [Termitomyces sp. T159_Od127]|nr:hypothetical protein C0993_005913 [Termitomyces sp. T159_Od127]
MANPQDATRVAGGYKATIKNPKVSEEAKANAHERLREMGTSAGVSSDQTKKDIGQDKYAGSPEDPDAPLSQQQLGGYKATIKSRRIYDILSARVVERMLLDPNVSEDAKQHAQEVLEAHDQSA